MQLNKSLIPLVLSAINLIMAGSASASVVYEKVGIFSSETFFTDSFQVAQAGTYQATLTDFEFPAPLSTAGLNITTSTTTLATLLAPGSTTFEANSGDYYVSGFATVGRVVLAATEAQIKESVIAERKAAWQAKWKSYSAEQRAEKRAEWAARSDEERTRQEERKSARLAATVAAELSEIDLGQYGIQIELLEASAALPDTTTVVPVPAALWLFASGLLALTSTARRNAGK